MHKLCETMPQAPTVAPYLCEIRSPGCTPFATLQGTQFLALYFGCLGGRAMDVPLAA